MLSLLVAVLAGCSGHYPADPHGTLNRVTGSILRVGVSHNKPFTSLEGETPAGEEVALIEEFASTLDAEIEWMDGSVEELVDQLEHGRLDMIIGGLTDQTPWQSKVGLTLPYAETTDEFGQTDKHVMAVRMGENAFLLELDTFLQSQAQQSRGGQSR
nr:transporter substrate-binding domain-containing protein [Brevibacterium daeguense]